MSSKDDKVAIMAEHKNIIDKHRAEEIVDEFFEYYEIDPEDEEPDSKGQLLKAKKKIIKAVMKGRLEFKLEADKKGVEKMIVYQHLKTPFANGTAVFRYRNMSGQAKQAMKGSGDNDSYGKVQSLMGYLSGTSAGIIADMQDVDYSMAECLGIVFLSL